MNEITLKIPYDIKVSSIDSLSLHDNATLEVKITFKKIVELNCKDCILLDILDNSSDLKAVLFDTNLIDYIKLGLNYRITGYMDILSDNDNFGELKKTKVFFINALQCYSNTFLGIDMDMFNLSLDLDEQYYAISKYTDYFKNINLSQVKDIKVSCYDELIYLLNDGKIYINSNKVLDNIKDIHYIDNHTIIAIGYDNTIACLTKKGISGANFLNNNDYIYKKIVTTEFGIVALTYEKIVVYFGTFVSSVIDVNRFINVDDIELDEKGIIFVIKNNIKYALFHDSEK